MNAVFLSLVKIITMRALFTALLLAVSVNSSSAKVLHVGLGQRYADLNAAVKSVLAGDTILVHNGKYAGGQSLQNLQGTGNKWIYLIAEKTGAVLLEGNATAMFGNDLAYVHIEGFVFAKQTDDGVNFSDGGTYVTPAHHIRFKDCTFRDIAGTGNNDLLKLSGVDDFIIQRCIFLNGAAGGSGIDMVGCHKGLITQCHFENMGSNAAQMKGGSCEIRIERCIFKNAGERAINLGGGTGLPFFRPIDAAWEASDLKVYSNIFIGSDVPVAFVGCTRSEVVNNTIYKPGKWVFRILQENRNTVRFGKCGNNVFSNNVISLDSKVNVVCNIGGSTLPGSFTFSNNAWFNTDNSTWAGAKLPAQEKNAILNKDPLFRNAATGDFSIIAGSPLAGSGAALPNPEKDYTGRPFKPGRAIGAFELK